MMQRITACGVSGWGEKMIDFKGVHYPRAVILNAVFFYVRYAVSYRDLEEILAERSVLVDHATLNRWVVKFSPLIAANALALNRSAIGALVAGVVQHRNLLLGFWCWVGSVANFFDFRRVT